MSLCRTANFQPPPKHQLGSGAGSQQLRLPLQEGSEQTGSPHFGRWEQPSSHSLSTRCAGTPQLWVDPAAGDVWPVDLCQGLAFLL